MACRTPLGSLILWFSHVTQQQTKGSISRDFAGEKAGQGRQDSAEDLSLVTDSSHLMWILILALYVLVV